MKKTFTLLAAALFGFSVVANAQVKKLWDFSKGVSETDRANLIADEANWTTNGEGSGAYWSEKTKLSGTIKANGVPLEFLEHLTVGTNGLNKNNNFKIGPSAYRMNRVGQRTYVPKLANGQTITVLARSANATATNRGLVGNANMKYVSGPAGGICPGVNVEGSEGTYTLVWEVVTSGADSVDCCIEIVGGGVDIQSIMIDNGDEPTAVDQKCVAYLYGGSSIDEDLVYTNFISNYQATAIDLTNTEAGIDSLVKFDVVVFAADLAAGNGYGLLLDQLDQKVPVLNLCTNLYEEAGWGKIEASEEEAYTVDEDYMDAAIFEGTNAGEGTLILFEGAPVYAATPAEGSFIGEDLYYATPGIHTHGEKRNQYLLLPFPADPEALGTMTDDAGQLLNNAINVLSETKKNATKTMAPAIAQSFKNGLTEVSLSCATAGANIFYCIDGADFAAYTEALNITKDGTVVKAYATARGYFAGDTASATINVQQQAAMPTIATTSVEGATTITLTVAEGLQAYYSFNGTTVAGSAVPYTEPVTVNEPVVLTCFTAGNGKLQSEILTQEVWVYGIPAVKDTVAHFTANQTDWFDNCELKDAEGNVMELPTANWSASAAYYFGKSAWAYYNTEDPKNKVVYDADGVTPLKSLVNPEQDSTVVYYDPNPASMRYIYSKTDSQWCITTQGQVLTGETSVAASTIYGPAQSGNGYFAETPFDMINNPSKGKLTFGGKGDGEPNSGAVVSTGKFAAPFDVVTYLTNGGTGSPVLTLEVSADGENWTTVKDTIAIGTKQRWYKRDRISVAAEMGEVYVRVRHRSGSSKAQLYDIYIITTEGATGIETLAADEAASAAETAIFDLQGRQVATMVSGQLYIKAGKKMIIK